GTINPGEQRTFAFYSGPASGVQSVSCSLAVAFPASVGMNGGGNGGGIIHIAGTLTASPLSVTQGDTVTITGAGILPPLFEEIRVTFDGVEVPGSPTSLIPPDGGLDVDVVVPLVSNGPHIIEVQGTYDAGTRVIRVTLASFTATVSGGLATTGAA